jgi:predicted metal-dependent hydrolase
MPRLQYGITAIDWVFKPDNALKRHYVTVERGRPVLLRGPHVDATEQEALVRKRARWIREKQAQVDMPQAHDLVVTGSRLKYGGRTYFTEVNHVPGLAVPSLRFTAARFVVCCPDGPQITSVQLEPFLQDFYRQKALERLPARVRHWERVSGLRATDIRIKAFESRWASCSKHDVLEFHPCVMELSASVQDYVVVHELCHTMEKNHTRAFWQLVSKLMPDWRKHQSALEGARIGRGI